MLFAHAHRLFIKHGGHAYRIALVVSLAGLMTLSPELFERVRASVWKDSVPQAGQTSEREIERAIQRFAAIPGGTVGISAIHIETGERIRVNGDQRFPMASTYKLPIALQLLHRVELKEVRLNDTVTLTPRDFRPGHSPLADFAAGTPLTLTVERLLQLMLGESDNTASDAIMRLANGPEAVTRRLRELSIKDVDVNRYEVQVISALYGVEELPPESEWSRELFQKLYVESSKGKRAAITENFLKDTRDTATPDDFANLLVRVYRGETVNAENTARVLQIMTATTTGPARLKALLPAGTPLAHKTGSWEVVGTINDAGIITLPGGAGHIAIAVFVKASSPEATDKSERAIAEIGRTVYDYFLLSQAAETRSQR